MGAVIISGHPISPGSSGRLPHIDSSSDGQKLYTISRKWSVRDRSPVSTMVFRCIFSDPITNGHYRFHLELLCISKASPVTTCFRINYFYFHHTSTVHHFLRTNTIE